MLRSVFYAAATAAMVAGCQYVAWYQPAPDQGPVVTNGRRLGVAHRISEDGKPGQSYLVLNVRHAFTTETRRGERHAIVRVEAILVNRAPVGAKLECENTTLEIAGRAFRPVKVRRAGWYGGIDRDEVAGGSWARFDLYYDLGAYRPSWEYAVAPPVLGGIPLGTLHEFTLNWRATWAGRRRVGSTRFVMDYSTLTSIGIEGDVGGEGYRSRTVWGLTAEEERLLTDY